MARKHRLVRFIPAQSIDHVLAACNALWQPNPHSGRIAANGAMITSRGKQTGVHHLGPLLIEATGGEYSTRDWWDSVEQHTGHDDHVDRADEAFRRIEAEVARVEDVPALPQGTAAALPAALRALLGLE